MQKKDKTQLLLSVILFCLAVIVVVMIKEYKQMMKKNEDNPEDVSPLGACQIGKASFDTLQEAIDSAKDFDIIEINQDMEGEYFIDNKMIRIEGKGHTLSYHEEGRNLDSFFFIRHSYLVMNNITLDGKNNVSQTTYNKGVYSQNSSLTFDQVVFTHFSHEEAKQSEYPYCHTLYLQSNETTQKYLFTKVTIRDFHQVGLFLYQFDEGSSSFEISNSTFAGLGKTKEISQKGIFLYGETTGKISNCTFEDIYSEIDFEEAYAVFCYPETIEIKMENNQYKVVQNELGKQ